VEAGVSGPVGVAGEKDPVDRPPATTTVARFFARAASRCTQRRCSRICARHAASIAAGGWPSWRRELWVRRHAQQILDGHATKVASQLGDFNVTPDDKRLDPIYDSALTPARDRG